MLIDVARQAVIEGINQKVGYPVIQNELSPEIRQSIEGLAIIQKNLYVMREVLNGERSRIQNNAIRSFLSKHIKNREINDEINQVGVLQSEINKKITEISDRIQNTKYTSQKGVSIGSISLSSQKEQDEKVGVNLIVLKCPSCGATLPMPTSQFVECEYCESTISIQDFGLQFKSMIQSL